MIPLRELLWNVGTNVRDYVKFIKDQQMPFFFDVILLVTKIYGTHQNT
jgi:hypothetical protein